MVLMGFGLPATGLLVERLVVPQADPLDPEQLGGGPGHPGVEVERPHLGIVLPQVLALDKRLLVAGFLGQRAAVWLLPLHDRLRDGGAEVVELAGRQQVGDHHETAGPERVGQVGGDQWRAHSARMLANPSARRLGSSAQSGASPPSTDRPSIP
jgi:hypothetical protein